MISKFPTAFLKHCPVCGRPLQVPVDSLGLQVICQHCGGRFLAAAESDAGERLSAGPGIFLQRMAYQLDEDLDPWADFGWHTRRQLPVRPKGSP